jgi:hypothetical protein
MGKLVIDSATQVENQSSIRRQQFFRWQSVGIQNENNASHILYTNSPTDILTKSCQDIYSALLVALVNNTGRKFDRVTVSASSDQVLLEEPKISAIIAAFAQSDLVTRSDAIACIIPGLRKYIVPEKRDSVHSSLMKFLQENDKYMYKADELINWMDLHSQINKGNTSPIRGTELFASGLIAVSEFCQRAFGVGQTKDARHSGYREFQHFIQKYRPDSGQAGGEIKDILA